MYNDTTRLMNGANETVLLREDEPRNKLPDKLATIPRHTRPLTTDGHVQRKGECAFTACSNGYILSD